MAPLLTASGHGVGKGGGLAGISGHVPSDEPPNIEQWNSEPNPEHERGTRNPER